MTAARFTAVVLSLRPHASGMVSWPRPTWAHGVAEGTILVFARMHSDNEAHRRRVGLG